MATPHPGNWELLRTSASCEVNTVDVAVHAAVVANPGTAAWRVLYFTGTRSFLWDPANPLQVSGPQTIPDWPTSGLSAPQDPPNFFCAGHSHMEDGRLLVGGGTRPAIPEPDPCAGGIRGLWYAYFFNPVMQQWTAAGSSGTPHRMAAGRWYPTLTTLGEDPGYNRVLAMSGYLDTLDNCNSVTNKDPELYDPLAGWSGMEDPKAATQPFNDLYPAAHLIPFGPHAGKVCYSMPMKQAWAFDPFAPVPPTNGGYWTALGAPRALTRGDGNAVLLPLLPGSGSAKVLIVGGDDTGTTTETAEIIDVAAGSPNWSPAAPMRVPRRHANAVLLPDDTVLLVGGDLSRDIDVPVLSAETYDVATDTWRVVAPMNRRRMYHSTAVLLPDGRVWVSGTLAGPHVERSIELYSPGYLFEGDRPAITSAPDTIHYGTPFTIHTSHLIAHIRLIRLGVATHSRDMDQRSVGLSFSQEDPTNGHTWDVAAPADGNVAPPGLYMLFVLRAESESDSGQTRIPSVAKVVQIRRP